ncbi:MAG: BolA family protein [Pseudomonadota bacterium]
MTATRRVELIKERLHAALAPTHLSIRDDSAAHAGHAGARGGGHFSVTVVTDGFTGKGLLQRHRMVYDALGAAMHSDIHALSIRAYTPQEFDSSLDKE